MDIITHTIPEATITIADGIETTTWADGHVTTCPADPPPTASAEAQIDSLIAIVQGATPTPPEVPTAESEPTDINEDLQPAI